MFSTFFTIYLSVLWTSNITLPSEVIRSYARDGQHAGHGTMILQRSSKDQMLLELDQEGAAFARGRQEIIPFAGCV